MAGNQQGDAIGEKQQKILAQRAQLQHRCRDGELLLQRHPHDGQAHLHNVSQAVIEIVNALRAHEAADTDTDKEGNPDRQAYLTAERASKLLHDDDPDTLVDNTAEWGEAHEAVRGRSEWHSRQAWKKVREQVSQ